MLLPARKLECFFSSEMSHVTPRITALRGPRAARTEHRSPSHGRQGPPGAPPGPCALHPPAPLLFLSSPNPFPLQTCCLCCPGISASNMPRANLQLSDLGSVSSQQRGRSRPPPLLRGSIPVLLCSWLLSLPGVHFCDGSSADYSLRSVSFAGTRTRSVLLTEACLE